MKNCNKCGEKYALIHGVAKGVEYEALRCPKCREEIMTMAQAKSFMKAVEETKTVTFSKWGTAIAVRIPAETVRRYKIRRKEKAKLLYDEKGFTIVPMPA